MWPFKKKVYNQNVLDGLLKSQEVLNKRFEMKLMSNEEYLKKAEKLRKEIEKCKKEIGYDY